jgi:hypothetical protein
MLLMIIDKWGKYIKLHKYCLPALKAQIGAAPKSSASFHGHLKQHMISYGETKRGKLG